MRIMAAEVEDEKKREKRKEKKKEKEKKRKKPRKAQFPQVSKARQTTILLF